MIRKTLLALPLALAACGGDGADDVQPTYSSISEKIFVPQCARTNGCHTSSDPAVGLDLTRENGRQSLLGQVQSTSWLGTQWESFQRVQSGDVAASALVPALRHPAGLPDILKMPTGAQLPEEWIAAIEQWIQEGAQDN